MPTISSLLAVLVTAVLLGSCATTPPPSSSPLTGHWRVDPATSDHVDSMVNAAISRAQERLRRRRGSRGGSLGTPGDNGPDADQSFDSAGDLLGNGLRIGPDFRQLRDRLMQTVGTPVQLHIEVTEGQLSIQRDDLPPRQYQPGELITRFDEYGAARLDSRWAGPAFEIRQRYTSGARLTERYELNAAGDLIYSRALQDPTVGKLDIKSLYRRTDQHP